MKQICLIHIMIALLLCTNVWATTHEVSSSEALTTAWENAGSGDIIKLTDDVTVTKTLWLGTQNLTDAARSLEIDLNGWDLTSSATYAFMLTHGALKISNSGAFGEGKLIGSSTCTNVFYITGSTNKDVDPSVDGANYFTHLEIAEGVIIAHEKYDAVISIDGIWLNGTAQKAQSSYIPSKPALSYITNVYASSETMTSKAVAHGVRVDIRGIINGQKYGIKTNGYLGTPTYYIENEYGVEGGSIAFAPSDYIPANYVIEKSEVKYSPFIHIYPAARITALDVQPSGTKSPSCLYASGYARWRIEGYVEGGVGATIKSGEVVIDAATVVGTGSTYTAAEATTSGTPASGSAIVIESSDAYIADIDVTISGDSYVKAMNGFAVDEAVSASDENTIVDVLTITSGTFQGGTVPVDSEDPSAGTTQGTMKITETTDDVSEIIITGGSVNGNDVNSVMIGDQTLAEFLSDSGESYITTIDDGQGGTTLIITAGTEPYGQESVIYAEDGTSVNWKHASSLDDTPMEEVLTSNLSLEKLQITQQYNQTLTISEGVTFRVGRVILGSKAKIIVEAGGKFIVTGEQGITANSADNIILKTSSSAQALFLVNPAVNANKHPKAMVQLYSKAYQRGDNSFAWQRFSTPSYQSDIQRVDMDFDSETYPTAVYKINTTNPMRYNKWDKITKYDRFVPFSSYILTTSSFSPGAIYVFRCNLVGNSDATLHLYSRYNYFANSYMAPISTTTMISDFSSKYSHLSGTIYLHESETDMWYEINNATPYIHPEYPSTIKPMETFILIRRAEGGDPVVDFENQVYTPAFEDNAPAPARQAAPFAAASIEIVAADGTKDGVSLVEGDQFSPEFDNTYDAEKLMLEDKTYLYASGCEGKMGILATDNIEGTTLSIKSAEQTSFTMRFSHVNDMDYAIRDELTGTETTIAEGATYMFSVPANTTITDRFTIVAAKKVPTTIDAIEANNATKSIYTIHGQYIGTDFHSLPAGIYIIDGKKIVK